MKIKKKYIWLLMILFILSMESAFAGQSLFGISNKSIGLVVSPFSGTGLARSFETAAGDTTQINYTNYALWSNLSLPSYSVKINYAAAFGDDGISNKYFNDVANFSGGYLAIPVMKRKLVLGMGLEPVTSMEQRIADSVNTNIKEDLLIRGGLSRVSLNISYKVFSNWGIGLGYEYNFGKILNQFNLEYSATEMVPLKFKYEYRFYGNGFVISTFYKPVKNFIIGAVYRPATTINARIQAVSSSTEVNESQLKRISLPAQYNLGLSYSPSNRFAFGLDLQYQDWQNEYKINDQLAGTNFQKYFRLGLGVERRQSKKLFTKFTEELDYRFGLFYGQLNQNSNGNPVKEYGVSAGLSIPIQRFRSHMDLYLNIGRRGDLNQNAYQETFLNVGLSISASEIWFVNYED